MKTKVLWITRTAVFIALLVALQAATRPMGQFVTGTIVNLILAVAVMTIGPAAGVTVSAVSPAMAWVFGIAPNPVLMPFIAIGNALFVLLWHFIGNIDKGNKYFVYIVAMVAAASAKFAALYLGVVHIAIPFILDLNETQTAVMSGMFSLPQLVTALAGGAIAIAIFPTLRKAIKR